MPDWLERTIKTFVQAFFGVLIPEICLILNGGLDNFDVVWATLAPILCSALAAGIAAAWNIILERLQ